MKFQDEGGLLLPPSIEQKISSTGTPLDVLKTQTPADTSPGKKYLALNIEAVPEDKAVGNVPALQ